jgi:hypothetical protein
MTRNEQESSKDPINISHIPVAGVGGLRLIAVAGLTVYVLPQLRPVGIPTLLGGVIVGMTLVAVRNPRARPWAIMGATLAAVMLVGLIIVIGRRL